MPRDGGTVNWSSNWHHAVLVTVAIMVVLPLVFFVLGSISTARLVERTNMPGKIWIYAGIPMTLAMPGLIQAMARVLL